MEKGILIVDDHQLVLDGLVSIIKDLDSFKVIGTARDGKRGMQLALELNPDIVLMDIDMPIMNGLEATRKIKESQSDIKIIVLTMHNEPSLIKKVMDLGADGYMLKNSDQSEFKEGLEKVAIGKAFFSSEVTESLLKPKSNNLVGNLDNEDVLLLAKLTGRELEVLKLIAEGSSNKEIGEKLYISHRTVDTHRTNLMKKIEVHNIAGLIKFAIQNGLTS